MGLHPFRTCFGCLGKSIAPDKMLVMLHRVPLGQSRCLLSRFADGVEAPPDGVAMYILAGVKPIADGRDILSQGCSHRYRFGKACFSTAQRLICHPKYRAQGKNFLKILLPTY